MTNKKLYKNLFILVAFVFLPLLKGFADDTSTVILPAHDAYTGVRSVGMGGAFAAIADDESSVFLNPAGIGKEDDSKVLLRGASFPNLTMCLNSLTLKMAKQFKDTSGNRQDKIENILLDVRDKDVVYGRFSLYPYLTFWRMQFGVLVDTEMQGYISNYEANLPSVFSTDAAPLTYNKKLFLWNRSQTTGVFGFSFPYKDLGLSLGVTARYSYRTSIFEEIEVSDNVIRKSSEKIVKRFNKTRGMAADVGLLYSVNKQWDPTFAISVRDLGDSKYQKMLDGFRDEVEKMNVVVGMSVRPIGGRKVRDNSLVFSLEGKRVNDARVLIKDKIALGMEYRIPITDWLAPFSIRAGYNLRGISYGATMDFLLFKIDTGSIVEAVDGDKGVRLDRRYFARLAVDLRT